jgi:alpha-L-arabinofuranosidase
VVKVVNSRPRTIRTEVDLRGRRLRDRGTVTTLSGALGDVNTFEQPDRVAPASAQESGLGNRFVYEFPANSVTFIRLRPDRWQR